MLRRRQVSGLAASVYPATRSPPVPLGARSLVSDPAHSAPPSQRGHHHAPLSWWDERSSQLPPGLSRLAVGEFLQSELFTVASPLKGELLPGSPVNMDQKSLWPFPPNQAKGYFTTSSKASGSPTPTHLGQTAFAGYKSTKALSASWPLFSFAQISLRNSQKAEIG